MRRLTLVLGLIAVSACRNFDAHLEGGCARDASWDICRTTPEDGGTGGGTGGGSAPMGGGVSSYDAGACVVGRNGWCWQNPTLGGATLGAVWGTGDDDVWVAGSGGVVMHFDGTGWSRSPMTDGLSGQSAVRAAVSLDGVEHWLCGEGLAVTRLDGTTGASLPTPGLQFACNFVDTLDGRVGFLRTDVQTAEAVVIRERDGGLTRLSLQPVGTDAGSIYRRIRMALDVDGGAVVTEIGSLASTLVSPAGRVQLPNPDGGVFMYVPSVRRDENGGVVALALSVGEESSYRSYLSSWSPPTSVWDAWWDVAGVSLSDFHVDVQNDGGVRWWFVGDGDAFGFTTRGQPFVPVPSQADSSAYRALWRSPQNSMWAAGEGGRVARWRDGETEPTVLTHRPQYEVHDLVLRDGKYFAVGGRGATWSLESTGWNYTPDSEAALLAVDRLVDGGLVTLDARGVVRMGTRRLNLLDAGYPNAERMGGLERSPNGHVWAALGTSLGEFDPDLDTWTVRDLNRSSGNNNAMELAIDDTGVVWVASCAMPGAFAFVDGGVHAYNPEDGGVTTFDLEMPAYSVTPRPTDGAYVAGLYAMFECTLFNGCQRIEYPPLDSRPVSVWTDVHGHVWLLIRDGRVWYWDGETWLPQPTPWSRGDDVDNTPLRLTGNHDAVFMVGGWGAIISRPLD